MDNIINQMRKADQIRKNQEKERNDRFRDASRDRMSENIEKKARTIFIGAINSFENEFGELWGIGKPLRDLTDEERFFRQKWDRCRKEVLDKGNNELRAMKTEISEYVVERKIVRRMFPVLGG